MLACAAHELITIVSMTFCEIIRRGCMLLLPLTFHSIVTRRHITYNCFSIFNFHDKLIISVMSNKYNLLVGEYFFIDNFERWVPKSVGDLKLGYFFWNFEFFKLMLEDFWKFHLKTIKNPSILHLNPHILFYLKGLETKKFDSNLLEKTQNRVPTPWFF